MDFSNIPFPEKLPQFWVINLSGRTGTFPTGSTSKDEAAGTTLRREANLRHPTADDSVVYKKVLGQVEAANFFRFDPKRRPLLGLSVKRNIHTDTGHSIHYFSQEQIDCTTFYGVGKASKGSR